MIEKGKIVENVPITGIGNDGKSVGRIDNFVLFVEDAVPGDIVDVRIYKKKKNFAEGRAIVVRKGSPDRTVPFCEHFGTCGGCKWQHLSYEKQLSFKQQVVADALQRIGGLELPEISPIIGSEKTQYYRNKLEFTFSNRAWVTAELKDIEKDTPALGFHVPFRFDKILDIRKCFLQDDISNAIRIETKNYCLQNGLTFFDLIKQEGNLRNLIIRNSASGEWMVIVVFHTIDDDQRIGLMEHLKRAFPFINSLLYIINQKRNDTIFDQDVIVYHGRDHIFEMMEELKFRISAKSFFQTNSHQALTLYKVVREYSNLTGKENVYDLYTGTGTIAAFVSRQAARVTGIDYVEDAIHDAELNAQENGVNNMTFFAGDIKDTMNGDFINKNGRPDVIITDPPRAGMHEEVVRAIDSAAPSRIVYVSCNPSTQARDLQLLNENYRIEKIQPVDMFPHTSHVENVALLLRK